MEVSRQSQMVCDGLNSEIKFSEAEMKAMGQ